MAHKVLARKWRPKKFGDLVGQQTAVTVLNNILQTKRLHHAYLLTGTRGVGKTTIARIIAKALNCTNLQGNEPCGNCNNCNDIDRGSFIDVVEIDAASNTGVDNIRELIDNAAYAPTLGKYKVYIIDEVHMLSKSAFNAMLKTLEEPPLHAIFVLATTDMQKVPITILSRCLQLKLRNLLPAEIATHLATILNHEGVSFSKEALEIIAQAAHGSVRDALSITDQAIAYTNGKINTDETKMMLGITDDAFIYNLLDALEQQNSHKITEIASEIYNQGYDLENVLFKLNQTFCDISLVQLGGIHSDKLQHYAQKFSVNDVQLYFEITTLGLEQIVKSSNKYQIFVMILMRTVAFTLGQSPEKQFILNSSNFNVRNTSVQPQPELVTAKAATSTPQQVEPKLQKDSLQQTANIMLQPKPVNPAQEPGQSIAQADNQPAILSEGTGWISLIEKLEDKLDKAIHPVLVNARFNSYANGQVNLTVDHKYEGIVNDKIIANITKIFSDYFGYPVKFNLIFSEKVENTVKEKRQIEQDQKQKLAEEAIHNDENLAQLKQLLSATIVPNSIKPV